MLLQTTVIAFLAQVTKAAIITAQAVTSFSQLTPQVYSITTATTVSTLSIYQPDLIHLKTTLNQNPPPRSPTNIAINPPAFDTSDVNDYQVQETATNYTLTGPVFSIVVNKSPLLFGIYAIGTKGNQVVFQELWPLTFDPVAGTTTQFLNQSWKSQNYGGGVQTNGFINQRNQTIAISNSASSNPSPVYFTNTNYAILRNTFSSGVYSFQSTLSTQHNETNYDAFIFLDPTLSNTLAPLLNTYTKLTGRVSLPPMQAFGVGDSNCYQNQTELTTTVSQYASMSMPLNWIISGDGCAIPTPLGALTAYLSSVNSSIVTANQYLSVGVSETVQDALAGTTNVLAHANFRSLDSRNASTSASVLQACDMIHGSIEKADANVRSVVLGVKNGWAGVQRSSVVSTGDATGSYANILTQLAAVQSAGMGGFSWISSDVDGVNPGVDGADAYIRDLQFKIFTPIVSIRGSSVSKRPWAFGEPYTTIARQYLNLRQSLLPYIYNIAYESTQTGFPMTRSMSLAFPLLTSTGTPNLTTQFLFGPSLLIAPVFTNTIVRNNIYLPNGTWFDFWNGMIFLGPQTINQYPCPLTTIPIFVQSPAIIPQLLPPPLAPNAPQYHPKPLTDTLTLSIYVTRGQILTYTLYADDGVTQQHNSEIFSTQQFTVDYTTSAHIYITIHPVVPNTEATPFLGAPTSRNYRIQLFTPDTIVKSSLAYKNMAVSGGTLFQVNSIASEQEAMIVVYTNPDRSHGGINYVGAVLVAVILLGLILLMVFYEKAKEHANGVGGVAGVVAVKEEMAQYKTVEGEEGV
ncbi:hypothetical protein HDU98_006203 [Podochytrium sp. JEL0797]|nr:hypothetical protein HDU98_006203 [Podochytrium sp. JEL0797]